MLLKPKKTKYTKSQKGRLSLVPKGNKILRTYALVALEPGRIKAVHIAAASLAIKRKLKLDKGLSQLHVRLFPHIPVTSKPAEVRMGKGKGNIDYWMTRVRRGSIIFEIECSSSALAQISFKIAGSKLPIKTEFKVKG